MTVPRITLPLYTQETIITTTFRFYLPKEIKKYDIVLTCSRNKRKNIMEKNYEINIMTSEISVALCLLLSLSEIGMI